MDENCLQFAKTEYIQDFTKSRNLVAGGAGYWSNTVIRVKRSVLFRMGLTLAFAGTNHGTIYPTLLSFLIVELAPVNMSFPVGAIWNCTRRRYRKDTTRHGRQGVSRFPCVSYSYVRMPMLCGRPNRTLSNVVASSAGSSFLTTGSGSQKSSGQLPACCSPTLMFCTAGKLSCCSWGGSLASSVRSESQLQPFPRVVFQK